MSTARDYLAAVQQRADQPVGWPAMSFEKAVALGDALKDRRRLVAALTAALDLADESRRTGRRLSALAVDEAITAALTPKENDS